MLYVIYNFLTFRLLVRRDVGQSFSFGLWAISFGNGAKQCFYYEIDTPEGEGHSGQLPVINVNKHKRVFVD